MMQPKAFLLLWVSALLFWLGVNGVMTILPLHMQALGYSASLAGWVLGLASLSALGTRLVLGSAVDRYGSRPILVAAGLLLPLSALAGQVSLGVPGLILLNILLGAAVSLLLTGGLAAAAAAASAEKRGRAMTWYGLANSLASLVAAPLIVPLFTNRGYGTVQVLVAICGLVAGLMGALVSVRSEADADRGRPRRAFLLRSAVRPGLVGAVVAVASGGFALVGPLKAEGLGLVNPGLYLSVQAGAVLLSRTVLGPLSDRWGRGWVIIPGLGSLVIGYALMGLVTDPLLALGAPALIGIGFGAAGAGLVPWTVDRAGAAERGLAINTFYLFWELALFVGQTMVGYLLTAGAEWAYAGVALVVILGLLFYLFPSPTKERGDQPILTGITVPPKLDG